MFASRAEVRDAAVSSRRLDDLRAVARKALNGRLLVDLVEDQVRVFDLTQPNANRYVPKRSAIGSLDAVGILLNRAEATVFE